MTAEQWLTGAAEPGLRRLRLAAGCQLLETIFTVVQWTGLAWVARDVLRGGRPSGLGLGVLLAGGLLAAGAAWSATRWQAAGRRRIAHAIRRRLVAAVLPTGQRRAEPDPATAALAAVELTDDIADHHAQTIPQRLSAPACMAVILLTTAAVQWPAAVILLLASLLVPLNMRLAGLLAKEGADERAAATTHLAAVVLDSFRGLPTLRGIGALTRRRTELAHTAADLNTTTMAVVRRALLSAAVMEVVVTFCIAANATYIGLSLLGYVRLDLAPGMTLFRGLLTLLLCPLYFQPMRAAATGYHSRQRALSAVPVISGLLEAAEAGTEPVRYQRERPAPVGAVTVVLDDLWFRYPGVEAPVLHDVNLTVHTGSWTVVAGPSGAGKTTLLSLIAGTRPPSRGTVRWLTPGGSSPPRLGTCAWIGQQTVLLPGTVADNIRVARPGAGRAEINRAVAAAGLDDVVARLPQGLDTPLGEGGFGLSTGEARRVAIARAYLSGAGLWILDEPTAHLDPETEARVIAALRRATRRRTVIVATHSAALAHTADLLLELADGSVHPVREATRV
ncbi:ATP-binding cassette domain-containing protein [Phytohabitans rumicis]|uniref:Thiol reductant ABC exporter subunit CydD n=1 Tax=Phytohabitans rumicis TaxID=1076125 RepID=A0A6V8LKX3_9ACTN|nr:ATP-binding cassette domain-containing protein [Phytohabitans rumicis]GFJ95528.1 thiol reductant ABC exporter subunit CydD [Phytohabitans rumicis]